MMCGVGGCLWVWCRCLVPLGGLWCRGALVMELVVPITWDANLGKCENKRVVVLR